MTRTRHDPLALNAETILALAPDASAAKAGQGLAKPKGWSGLGRDERALWGEFQGSALYQVRADLSDLTTRCSCPSRKFPCKHGLGLLLLAANDPAGVPIAAAPEWVRDWLARRAADAEKRAAKQEATSATPDSDDTIVPAAPPARADKSATRRLSRVNAGLDGLDRWLDDLLRAGLAHVGTQPTSFWEGQAARLTDAQAAGLAGRVRRLATLPNATPDWPARLLADLGRLTLLGHAFRHVDTLDEALRDDVRGAIGWTLTQEEVLARGETVRDEWVVLGEIIETEERLRAQRVWLRGTTSGRPALILQFAHGSGAFAENFVAGSRFDAELTFWPSAFPLRALLRARHGPPERLTALAGHATFGAFLDRAAEALARQPWLDRHLAILTGVTPLPQDAGDWCVRDHEGASLPLARTDHWRLLALSGGMPLTLVAEWDGETLLPLGALVDGTFHRLTEAHSAVATPRRAAVVHDQLTQAALLGTAQGGQPPALTSPADTLAQTPDATPERRLLLLAGARAIYARAGQLAGSGTAAPEPATTERLPLCPPGAARLVASLLSGDHADLLPEALDRLAAAGWIVPPTLLPQLFAAGTRNVALRPALVAIAGERGRWLARQNRAWGWVRPTDIGNALPPDAERRWEEGTTTERLTLLSALRATDPARGRAWLAAAWKGEKAQFRAEAVEMLKIGLTDADESFLEEALDDRSIAVNTAAALVLAQLPTSVLVARMRERADRILSYTPPARGGFLRAVGRSLGVREQPGTLIFTPPTELDPAWQRDGLRAKADPGIDEHAWWAMRTLVHVPATHWTARFAATPEALIAVAAQHENHAALIGGWTQAALLEADVDWLAALWSYWADDSGERKPQDLPADLLRLILDGLPAERICPLATATLLAGADRDVSSWGVVAPLLPRPWDPALGARVLEVLTRRIAARRSYDLWLSSIDEIALALHPANFALARREWPIGDGQDYQTQRWQRVFERFTATIEMRERIHAEIPL
jgi:hypothetical protein